MLGAGHGSSVYELFPQETFNYLRLLKTSSTCKKKVNSWKKEIISVSLYSVTVYGQISKCDMPSI